MNTAYYTKLITEIGEIFVASSDEGLCRVSLPSEDFDDSIIWLNKHFDKVVESIEENVDVSKQLISYIQGKLKDFDVKLHLIGTPFQKKVWSTLLNVPYGKVISYKKLAEMAGSPKGFRAVGMANNKNPIPIIIPCHRVIGHRGDLVGYGGGLEMKKTLLQLEGIIINKGKVVT